MIDEVSVRIGSVVRALRGRRDITQQDLATSVGLGSGQIISQIEKGERPLKASEVVRLADFFRVPTADLLVGREPPERPAILWRCDADMAGRDEDEALFVDRCRRYAFVEQLAGEETPSPLPRYDLDLDRTRFEDVEEWANVVGSALRLGNRPGPVLRSALENEWGVKIFFSALKSGSGAAVRGEFGDEIAENRNEVKGRRAFSLAHELFHLITWESSVNRLPSLSDSQQRRIEQLANVFASALLLPAPGLERALFKRGRKHGAKILEAVAACKAFCVSPTALAWRAVNLGWLKPENVDAVIEAICDAGAMASAHRHQGEETVTPELPERYVLLAFGAYLAGKISVGKLAEIMETTVGMLNPALAAYELDLDSDAYQAEALPA